MSTKSQIDIIVKEISWMNKFIACDKFENIAFLYSSIVSDCFVSSFNAFERNAD